MNLQGLPTDRLIGLEPTMHSSGNTLLWWMKKVFYTAIVYHPFDFPFHLWYISNQNKLKNYCSFVHHFLKFLKKNIIFLIFRCPQICCIHNLSCFTETWSFSHSEHFFINLYQIKRLECMQTYLFRLLRWLLYKG